MTANYFSLLFERLDAVHRQAPGDALWVADEQVTTVPSSLAGLPLLTNRWDLYQQGVTQGLAAHFSDFDFGQWREEALACVAYRISKEKAVVHRVINEALRRLAPGGTLWLVGHKQEGIRTYVDKAAACAGRPPQLQRLGGGGLLAGITRGATLNAVLDDQGYDDWRRLAEPEALWTKPGIFGWQQIDSGSALLAAQLATAFPQPPRRVLDLGCGYGLLAVSAARQWPESTVIATDNNAAAVAAAARNLAEVLPAAQWQALPGDCGDRVEGLVDVVLCNPPFHRGFTAEGDLTERFLQGAAARLRRGGTALFVVNAFIPLAVRSQRYFAKAATIAGNRRFSVVLLTR